MRRLSFLLLVIILVLGAGYWLYQRPLPQLEAQTITPTQVADTAISLPWPTYGQAAFGAVGFGVLDSNHDDKQTPIASIAKVITALAILKQKPLQAKESGPQITLTANDVKVFNEYLAKDGSVVPVKAGEKITERQALEAMMLPSANNIAYTAAVWAFGSLDNYVTYANQFVKELGMTKTNVADASGFSPKTVSTAKDLVILGVTAMQNPALAKIISQKSATFPGVGVIQNLNWLLNTDGIIGIKTGNTDQAGGCYLVAARRTVVGQQITVVAAVLGAKDRNIAMADARKLVIAADKGFEMVTVVHKGQVVGRYNLPWGGSVDAVAYKNLKVLNWKGQKVAISPALYALQEPTAKDTPAGSIQVGNGSNAESTTVVLKQPVDAPSWTWRIFR